MKGNKGFSLVELIIVIAIMAILVGVIAPQLVRYIEKSAVSSDMQLCDNVRQAIIVALSDPEVIESTEQADLDCIAKFTGGSNNSFALAGSCSQCKFTDTVAEILGYNPFQANPAGYIKSTPARNSGELSCYATSDGKFYIFITNSDRNGEKNGYTNPASEPVIIAPLL